MGFSREEEKDIDPLKTVPGRHDHREPQYGKPDRGSRLGRTTAIGFGNEGFKLYNNEAVVFYQMPNGSHRWGLDCFFRASDVVSAGDIFTTTSYPVIETENGGTVAGFIDALNDLIEILVPKYGEEGGTYVIPGHGHLSDRADVVNYRDMVTIIRGRIQKMVKNGMTLEQVKAAKPTLDYDGIYGADGGRQIHGDRLSRNRKNSESARAKVAGAGNNDDQDLSKERGHPHYSVGNFVGEPPPHLGDGAAHPPRSARPDGRRSARLSKGERGSRSDRLLGLHRG